MCNSTCMTTMSLPKEQIKNLNLRSCRGRRRRDRRGCFCHVSPPDRKKKIGSAFNSWLTAAVQLLAKYDEWKIKVRKYMQRNRLAGSSCLLGRAPNVLCTRIPSLVLKHVHVKFQPEKKSTRKLERGWLKKKSHPTFKLMTSTKSCWIEKNVLLLQEY